VIDRIRFEEASMATTIVVMPERLRRAAAAARVLGGRLLEVRGQLGATLTGVESALGDGEAQAAFTTLWTRWSGSADGLARAVDDLAARLEAAADRYEQADRLGARAAAPPAVPPLVPGSAGTPPVPPLGAGGSASGGTAAGGGTDAAAR
jgi:WXG100 family type VII secretion target